jgi:lipopolysaccharide assembly protein B
MTFTNLLFLLLAVALVIGVAYRFINRRLEGETPIDAFISGLEAMLSKDWKQAAHFLRMAVESDSDNIRAYEKLGQVYRELGETGRAMKIHRELTIRGGLTAHDRSRVYLELSRDLRFLGQLDEAVTTVNRAVKADRRHLAALLAKLELHEIQDQWSEALETLKRIESLSDCDQKLRRSLILVEQARQKVASGSGRAGLILSKDALKLHPGCAAAYLLMGDSYLEEGRIDEAISNWEKVPFETPGHAALVFERLEGVFFEHGRFGEMEAFYQRVITSQPADPEAYRALAGFYERKGEYDRAILVLEEGLEKTDGSMLLARMMVRILGRSGETGRLCSFTVELADHLMEMAAKWRCHSCGHETGDYDFRCPKCRMWDSLEKAHNC